MLEVQLVLLQEHFQQLVLLAFRPILRFQEELLHCFKRRFIPLVLLIWELLIKLEEHFQQNLINLRFLQHHEVQIRYQLVFIILKQQVHLLHLYKKVEQKPMVNLANCGELMHANRLIRGVKLHMLFFLII